MKPHRNLFLILFLGANVLFIAACALTGAAPAAQNSVPAAQPTAAPQSAQSDQATATNAPAADATATQPAAPTQAAPVLSSDDAIKAAQEAWARLATAGPRHISQTSYQGDTVIATTEADSVPPNLHQVTNVMGTVMEQYFYDGTIYNKVKGEWSQLPGGAKTFTNTLEGFAQGVNSALVLADGKVVGIEDINGKPATAYSYTSTLKGLDVKPAQYTIWVDNASGLPTKRVNVSPDGLKIVQLITYDASIQITLPDEAKNAKLAK